MAKPPEVKGVQGSLKGPHSNRWKGEKASYTSKHMYMSRYYTKEACEKCGKTKLEGRLEWANISGKYLRDRSDWKVMCVPCHRIMDLRKPFCSNGHEYTPENTYLIKNTTWRHCRTCSRERAKANYVPKNRDKSAK